MPGFDRSAGIAAALLFMSRRPYQWNWALLLPFWARLFFTLFVIFLVRRADDEALGMVSVMIGHVPLAVLALLWMGLPPLARAPYVLMSAVLHVG